MGQEGIHRFQFHLRAVRYGSAELSATSPGVDLASFRLRTGSRFAYEYDLDVPWRHETRVEPQVQPEAGRPYPLCLEWSRRLFGREQRRTGGPPCPAA